MKSNNKKIMILVLALVILIGIIVVAVKGFNVSLDLREHDTLKFVFDQKFEKADVEGVCKEVFGDKEYMIKTVEVFTDAVYVIAPSIDETEEEALLTKLNDLYKTEDVDEVASEEETVQEDIEETSSEEATQTSIYDELEQGTDYDLYKDAKVRIRDMVNPYIVPSIISALIICVYIAIKYKKLNNGKFLITVCKTLGETLVITAIVLSIIAIFRIPFTSTIIPIVMFIILVCLVIRLANFEIKLKKLEEEK
jgi:hypothetical protein